MTDQLHFATYTRIRDLKWGKKGIVLAYTTKNEMVVEWENGSVTKFDGAVEPLEMPQGMPLAEIGDLSKSNLPHVTFFNVDDKHWFVDGDTVKGVMTHLLEMLEETRSDPRDTKFVVRVGSHGLDILVHHSEVSQ